MLFLAELFPQIVKFKKIKNKPIKHDFHHMLTFLRHLFCLFL
ncbi:hypothetical protein KKH3_44160 [Pectobacterium actinidiae]|nr:hypothetical protein KKH3_44160 [Pectobacterium actinidiae]